MTPPWCRREREGRDFYEGDEAGPGPGATFLFPFFFPFMVHGQWKGEIKKKERKGGRQGENNGVVCRFFPPPPFFFLFFSLRSSRKGLMKVGYIYFNNNKLLFFFILSFHIFILLEKRGGGGGGGGGLFYPHKKRGGGGGGGGGFFFFCRVGATTPPRNPFFPSSFLSHATPHAWERAHTPLPFFFFLLRGESLADGGRKSPHCKWPWTGGRLSSFPLLFFFERRLIALRKKNRCRRLPRTPPFPPPLFFFSSKGAEAEILIFTACPTAAEETSFAFFFFFFTFGGRRPQHRLDPRPPGFLFFLRGVFSFFLQKRVVRSRRVREIDRSAPDLSFSFFFSLRAAASRRPGPRRVLSRTMCARVGAESARPRRGRELHHFFLPLFFFFPFSFLFFKNAAAGVFRPPRLLSLLPFFFRGRFGPKG